MSEPNIYAATHAARARYDSITRSTSASVVLYEIMPDGGITFGVKPNNIRNAHWRDYAINPDGGKAYPLS